MNKAIKIALPLAAIGVACWVVHEKKKNSLVKNMKFTKDGLQLGKVK
ncbi:MAG: hypothetical protein F6I01_002285 [Aerococcus sanguinicola]|nr:hypothetical protein [Aerococcus sp. HMSC062A02]